MKKAMIESEYQSPLGTILLQSDGTYLTGLYFTDQRFFSYDNSEKNDSCPDVPVIKLTKEWLSSYFQGQNPGPIPPVKFEGTPFQLSVWTRLEKIPYGEFVSYGDIAKDIAKERGINRMSAQAVGQAVGRNPISILVPCHRVLGSDKSLTGYGGGIERKIALLNLEKISFRQ